MRPSREPSTQQHAAYFVSSQTAKRQPFFRHERWAYLLKETILHYAQSSYTLHAYVLMPDHIHLLITPHETLEKTMSLIKGGFSFRAKRAFDWNSEIWQQGFSDHRIRDEADWQNHLEYIRQNPIRAGLVERAEDYAYLAFPARDIPQGLKPHLILESSNVRAEARTLQHNGTGAF
jgi:putative transposase